MSNLSGKRRTKFRKSLTYILGVDFSQEEYDKWLAEITLWISETQVREDDPKEKARLILEAAMSGTKLDGTLWNGVESFTFDKRIRQLCSYDIIDGIGTRRRTKAGTKEGVNQQNSATNKAKKQNIDVLEKISLQRLTEERDKYKKVLYSEFPFLDNAVYESKVNAYADTVVKLEQLSEYFLGASGKDLENYLKIREQLRKDLDDFMKLLRIHPSQIKEKVDEGDRGDVGNLINNWEEYGELGQLYEEVDAIQEAIQIFNQLNNVRMDGSPQLAEWLLWHKTGCRGHNFTCECGREYDLHGGFTKDEMYKILEQAYETFGYGIKRVDDNDTERPKITEQAEESEA